jgi:hypothetical protein
MQKWKVNDHWIDGISDTAFLLIMNSFVAYIAIECLLAYRYEMGWSKCYSVVSCWSFKS